MQAREIEPKLKQLSRLAWSTEPALAQRLDEVTRWIKDIRPGLLMQKGVLVGFLLELIKDGEFWLKLQSLTNEERQLFLSHLPSPVRYWYENLFPKWFNENDRKFYIWKQKLRSGEFNQEDADILKSVARQIKSRDGCVVHRYIADLSMATDVIVSSSTGKPLCVQLTTMSGELCNDKYNEWKSTLQQWKIRRGIFVSYNPGQDRSVIQLVNLVLHNSRHLTEAKYIKFCFR
ncbi:MAG: hypothetical protein F6K54_16930 [Okeania sp. SIO3B5]|uniref:hypothetical protein n=1 Tax=Okeania sp. SIO3B5 TaxID=2607811 RepID=UPI00140124B7|nr:hypothetical protein [Okeania sp. SIO3B5]NEO54616.1 hypothetical protein [Okeania sp. SIO3B5]